MEYRTTKIPTPVYEQVELARSKFAIEKSRLKNLPTEVLRPHKCPICGGKMVGAEIRARFGYYKCTQCDYKQPVLDIEAITSGSSGLMALGSGIIIGLGIAALLYLMFSEEK
jgi:predicted RNA-binding Zn-ribbon protein involved in translation (DUF1610 family)